MNINLNTPIVLQLNANWQPVAQKTIKDAIIAMTSQGHTPPALALDISYSMGEDGEYDFSQPEYINAVGWDDWANLDIEPYHMVIRSANRSFRAPTVLIAPAFHKMPTRQPKLTKQSIYERDGGICQYTGKKIPKNLGNIDHFIARSTGGKNTWENLVWCDSSVNSKKGNRKAEDVGLKLIRKPMAPSARPVSDNYKVARHPTWIPFIGKTKVG